MFSTKRKRNKLGQFTKISPWTKRFSRFAPATLLIIGMLFFNVFPTNAYFNDTESSVGNAYTAGMLDINISGRNVSGVVLPSNATTTTITLSKSNPANLDYQYFASTTILDADQTACNYVTISASSSPQIISLPLKNFVSATSSTTSSAQWDFTFTVAGSVPTADLGKVCNFKIIYTAWQTNLPDSSGGFSDVEEMVGSIQIGNASTAGVVLNEFLPNPDGFEYGFDFGTDGDLMPKGEWVELYNNSGAKIDLSGWYIWDNSGESHHKVYIASTNTNLATTTIQTHGWLVVYMNHEILNNSEDIITLYNNSNAIKDSYHYKGRDYLDLKPTPGLENATSTSGTPSVSDVPGNKSYARIPDGTGDWVDPIPTPGEPNKVEEILGGGESLTAQMAGNEPLVTETSTSTEPIATSTDSTASTTSEIATTTEPIATTTENVILDNATSSPEVISEAPSPSQSSSAEASVGQGETGGDEVVEPDLTAQIPVVEPLPEPIIEPETI